MDKAGPTRTPGAQLSPPGTPEGQFRDPREVFRINPLLYQLFYELGGDFEKIHQKLYQVHTQTPQEVQALSEVAAKALQHFTDNAILNFVAGSVSELQGRPLLGVVAYKKSLDLCLRTDDHSNALFVIGRLADVFPRDLTLAERRAEHLHRLGKASEAADTLERAGDECLRDRRFVPAAQCFWRAYLLDRSRRNLARRVVESLTASPSKKSALDLINKLLPKDPKNPFLYLGRGGLQQMLGQKQEADQDLTLALELAGDSVEDLVLLQKDLGRLGSADHARHCNQKLLELDPQSTRRQEVLDRLSGQAQRTAAQASAMAAQGAVRTGEGAAAKEAAGPESEAARVRETERGRFSLVTTVAKFAIVVGGLGTLAAIGIPIWENVSRTLSEEKLRTDEKEIQSIVMRLDGTGVAITDHSLKNVAGGDSAKDHVPVDPWGNDYIFDWLQGRIISRGADGQLQTEVPGFPERPSPGGPGDDVLLRPRPSESRIIFVVGGDTARAVRYAFLDKQEGLSWIDVSWHLLGVDYHSRTKLVLLSAQLASRETAVFLKDPALADPRRLPLAGGGATHAAWASETGESLVVQVPRQAGGPPASPSAIMLVDLTLPKPDAKAGSIPAVVRQVSLSTGLDDAWEPGVVLSRREVYFGGRKGATSGIYKVVKPGDPPLLVVSRPGSFLHAPVPSPDGRYLAFVRTSSRDAGGADTGAAVMEVVELGSREKVSEVDDVHPGAFPAWGREADRVVFLKADGGKNRLVIAHLKKNLKVPLNLTGIAPGRLSWAALRLGGFGSR